MFIVNVEGAVRQGDRWLVIERSMKETHAGGMLALVGGKVDAEENALDIVERTVRREIEEEVGITVREDVRFVYSSSFTTHDGRKVINMVFLCEYESGTAHCKSPDEVAAVHWLTLDEIASHPLTPPWTLESFRRLAAMEDDHGLVY